MRSTAYDLSQFAPQREAPAKPSVKVIDNPRRKKSYRAYRLRLTFCSVALFALMALTVYNNMLLTETRAKVVSGTEELTQLVSEYSYLNCELENMVSLKNASDYAENELGLIKVAANQIEYVNLRSGNHIIEGENSAAENIFGELMGVLKTVFAG